MLKNELSSIKGLIDDFALSGFDDVSACELSPAAVQKKIDDTFTGVRDAWSDAAFSTADDHCLRRYFSFHLEGIRESLDTLHCCDPPHPFSTLLKSELLALIQYHGRYFGDYFNFNAVAPFAFCTAVSEVSGPALKHIQTKLQGPAICLPLRECLESYFKQMNLADDSVQHTYSAVRYFERMVKELHNVLTNGSDDNLHEVIISKLTDLNFNALSFFSFRQRSIRTLLDSAPLEQQLKMLGEEMNALTLLPEPDIVYDARWPSLPKMLKGWVGEELAMVKEIMCVSQHRLGDSAAEKLSLNLSVAQLACFTRLFFEEKIFNTLALTSIFKYLAMHCQTKRQSRISAGSLSKEYYSISQVTAAVVRDKLLKMVSRINHDYFPLLAVASAAGLLCSALR